MVGFCYHFALLHCALLRATGAPARIRCGFAGYFEPQRWIDHWVVEYWNGDGWLLTDPQIGRGNLTGEHFQDGGLCLEPVPKRSFDAGCLRQRGTAGLGRIARQPGQ
jgi:transglutaminase-like putative cysteine protease